MTRTNAIESSEIDSRQPSITHAPWLQKWYVASGPDIGVFGWIILIHATAVVGLVVYPLPGWTLFAGMLALAFVGGMGTTVCYHRAIAHRALELNPWARGILTFVAMFNGSGAPASWASRHRQHHASADTIDDVSSPVFGGFWWAQLRSRFRLLDRYISDGLRSSGWALFVFVSHYTRNASSTAYVIANPALRSAKTPAATSNGSRSCICCKARTGIVIITHGRVSRDSDGTGGSPTRATRSSWVWRSWVLRPTFATDGVIRTATAAGV
jgi:hypothetical protein